jgi:hypothetical protein
MPSVIDVSLCDTRLEKLLDVSMMIFALQRFLGFAIERSSLDVAA